VWKKMHGESGGTSGIDNEIAERSFENVGAFILQYVWPGAPAVA
jgi:hypothetical protein